ncbi:MAG TPA: nitroreductase family protein [Bacteroidales bacterium]|nr:nitroreductase family protein [Bacteroidales bacterium]
MKIQDLVEKNRTRRRFDQDHKIKSDLLEKLVNLGRLSPSGANRQPLKYIIVNEPGICSRVFPYTAWAAYLKDWPGPGEGERPTAYIIVLGDRSVSENFGVDHGIAAQSIMLGAVEEGLGGCIIASLKKDGLRAELKIPDQYEILLVLAIGKPVEEVVIEEINNGDVKYWRDGNKVHHVPKRSLDEIILKL